MRRYLPIVVFAGVSILAAFLGLVWLVSASSPGYSDSAQQHKHQGLTAQQHAHQGLTLMRQHLYHAAIDEFEAATRESPGALDPWVGLAAVYIRLGNGAKALEGASKAVDLAADSADAQIVLGRAHWLAQNFERAEKAALHAATLDPSYDHAADLLLHIYFDRNDQARFNEVLDRVDNPSRPIQDLAVQFAVRNGEFARAYDLRKRFDRRDLEGQVLRSQLALKREPHRVDLYPVLIRNLISLGRFEDVIAVKDQYGGLDSVDLMVGHAYWSAGDRDKAIRAYEHASAAKRHALSSEVALAAITGDRRHWHAAFRAEWIEKDYFVLAQLEKWIKTAAPVDRALIYRYAGVFDRDLLGKAAGEARSVLDTDPYQFEALMTLGTSYLRQGQIDDGLRYVRQGAERYPERPEIWSLWGQLALVKQDWTLAGEYFSKAVRMEPTNASYLYNYAWLLDQTGHDAEAVPYYKQAIAASSLSFEAMNNLALIEAARGRSDRALALLNRAVSSNPQNESAYLNRANYYATIRSWRNAVADYARAIELNPASAYARVESARLHLEIDRVDIAIDELNAALDLDPKAADAYVLLSAAYKRQGREMESDAALREAEQLKGAQ